jgi:hypothetical protein
MGPARVFAVPPGGSKRILQLDEPAPTRVTRSKSANVTNLEETLLHNDRVSSQHNEDMLSMDEETNMQSNMQIQLSPIVTRARSQPAFSEQIDQPMHDAAADDADDEGKCIF